MIFDKKYNNLITVCCTATLSDSKYSAYLRWMQYEVFGLIENYQEFEYALHFYDWFLSTLIIHERYFYLRYGQRVP